MEKLNWSAEECTNGGVIICFGDPKDWSVQRLQVIDKKVAKVILAAPKMLETLMNVKDLMNKQKEWLASKGINTSTQMERKIFEALENAINETNK